MKTVGSITIDRPIEEVFRLTTEDVAAWSIIVVKDEMIEAKNGGGVGSTFRTVTEENGKQMEFHGEVTAFDPPRHHAVVMIGDIFDLTADYTFEDLAGKTKVTQLSTVNGKGLFRWLLPIMGVFMRKSSCDALQQELNSLKDFCEQHEPQAV